MAQHSKGPWAAGKGGYADRVYDGNDPMATVCEIYYGSRSREEIAANRRLIAAAPDLLRTCEVILRKDSIDGERVYLRELVLRAGGVVPEEEDDEAPSNDLAERRAL